MRKQISQFVSQSQFARMQGVSPQRVGQWVQTGIITLTPDKKVDVKAATLELKRKLDLRKRDDWETAFNKKIRPKKSLPQKSPDPRERIQEYVVKKDFLETINGEEFIIPRGTVMRVYGRPGQKRVQVAFFPAGSKDRRIKK